MGMPIILTEIKNANLKGLISSVYADLLEFIFTNSSSISIFSQIQAASVYFHKFKQHQYIFTNSSSISIFETKELTFVNDCFKYERNEEIGHYRQTLIKKAIFVTVYIIHPVTFNSFMRPEKY